MSNFKLLISCSIIQASQIFLLIVLIITWTGLQSARALQAYEAPLTASGENRKNPGSQGLDAKGMPMWLTLEPGLDFCEVRLNEDDAKLTALRIDPDKFDFVLGSSGKDGGGPRTLEKWATDYNLKAAINASMYLPDNLKSTGYMRSGNYINNGRIMERFGAFFVAGPRKEGIPRATILDRDEAGWRERLDDYETVIQNYRMTNERRKILWSPGGPLYSISAVAEDGDGRILFLHSRVPQEAYSFIQQLLHLPLDVRTVMYVEGGAQAGLLVDSEKLSRNLAGAHAPSFLVTGKVKAAIPNIIGIRSRPSLGKEQKDKIVKDNIEAPL